MADLNAYDELKKARAAKAAAEQRAIAAESSLYDGYMRATLAGLVTKLDWETPAQNIADQAEKITLACLRARARYVAGLSPNVPPVPQGKNQPKEK